MGAFELPVGFVEALEKSGAERADQLALNGLGATQ